MFRLLGHGPETPDLTHDRRLTARPAVLAKRRAGPSPFPSLGRRSGPTRISPTIQPPEEISGKMEIIPRCQQLGSWHVAWMRFRCDSGRSPSRDTEPYPRLSATRPDRPAAARTLPLRCLRSPRAKLEISAAPVLE